MTASPPAAPDGTAAGVQHLFRILCVDDNRDAADSTVMLLRLVGFDGRACYDGPTALAEARRFLPGLCLIDWNMPGMGGGELAGRLRAWATEARHPMVLVAVSANSGDEFRVQASAAGFDQNLVKPVDPFQLVGVVNRLWKALGPVS